ncbi:MAG: hypothetical protein JWM16_5850 [Verrucomicrobiales bacterium]|nr:hypothetical protein [Verrucomicrobiales bacterium]
MSQFLQPHADENVDAIEMNGTREGRDKMKSRISLAR